MIIFSNDNCLEIVWTSFGYEIKRMPKGKIARASSTDCDQLNLTRPFISSYRIKVRRISKILKERPRTSRQEAVDWIEYTHMTNGARHLRSQQYQLQFHQEYMLDIMIIILFVIYCISKMIKYLSSLFIFNILRFR